MLNDDYIIKLRKKLADAEKNGDLINLLLVCERIVGLYKNKGIEDGYDYAEDMYRVATIFLNTGRIDKAVAVYERVEKITDNLANADQLKADALNNLAICYVNKNELSKAYKTFKSALALKKLIYGEDSMECIQLLCNLGGVLFDKEDYDKAIYYHFEALNKRKSKDIYFADNLNFLGYDFEAKGELENAINYFSQALAIIKATNGPNSTDYMANAYYLAGIYEKNEQYEKALKYYDIVIEKIKDTGKEDHPYHAEALGKMANVCVKLENYQRALMFSIKATAIIKKAMGENHIYYANSVKNVADIHFKTKDFKRAIALYEEEVALKTKILGQTNDVTITAILHLADVYIKNENIEKAKDICQSLLKAIDRSNAMYYSCLLALVRAYTYNNNIELLYSVYDVAKEIKAKLSFDDMLKEAFEADTAENDFDIKTAGKDKNGENNKATTKKNVKENNKPLEELEQLSFDFSNENEERAVEKTLKENEEELQRNTGKSEKNVLNSKEAYEQESFDSFFKNDNDEL